MVEAQAALARKIDIDFGADALQDNVPTEHDFILIDRSGSMAGRWNDTVGGVNAYVAGLASKPETANVRVTVVTFATTPDRKMVFDTWRNAVDASEWEPLNPLERIPRGGTPLLDAIARLVTMAMSAAPTKSAIIIVTDGEENESIYTNRDRAKALLDECRSKDWQVLFFGVDFDNFKQSKGLGASAYATAVVTPDSFGYAMRSASSTRAVYSVTGQSMGFTDEEKQAFRGKKA